jgi:HAD superfamily hydrolase (TIGR01509 family)
MPFAAAIFDMDGLLIDSERHVMRAWLDHAAARGRPLADDDYLACVGRARAESDAILAALLGSHDLMRDVRDAVEAQLARPGNGFPLRPGAAALLTALAGQGVRCAVASSSTRDEIAQRLEEVAVSAHFVAHAGGDEVPRGKPDPAVYLLAAARLGVRAADCLAFEDSMPGATAALAAGMQVIVVPDLRSPSPEVSARCLAVLASLHDAVPHVGRWFGSR